MLVEKYQEKYVWKQLYTKTIAKERIDSTFIKIECVVPSK